MPAGLLFCVCTNLHIFFSIFTLQLKQNFFLVELRNLCRCYQVFEYGCMRRGLLGLLLKTQQQNKSTRPDHLKKTRQQFLFFNFSLWLILQFWLSNTTKKKTSTHKKGCGFCLANLHPPWTHSHPYIHTSLFWFFCSPLLVPKAYIIDLDFNKIPIYPRHPFSLSLHKLKYTCIYDFY